MAVTDLSICKITSIYVTEKPQRRGFRVPSIKASSSPSWSTSSWMPKKGHDFKESINQEAVIKEFESMGPLVGPKRIRKLENYLGEAALGKAFVFQDGDFDDLNPEHSVATLVKKATHLALGAQLPIIKVGSVAELGKYQDPDMNVEDFFTEELSLERDDDSSKRIPYPIRMKWAYQQSLASCNHILNVASEDESKFVWTSHECLLLPFEQAFTRKDSASGLYYDCSAHMLWLSEDFAQLLDDGAHVEFLKGISNPIGIKISDKLNPDELVKLLNLLNPDKRPGRITVLIMMTSSLIRDNLPDLIQAVHRANQIVTWILDPVPKHITHRSRRLLFAHLQDAAATFFYVLDREGSYPGGLHLELSRQTGMENDDHRLDGVVVFGSMLWGRHFEPHRLAKKLFQKPS